MQRRVTKRNPRGVPAKDETQTESRQDSIRVRGTVIEYEVRRSKRRKKTVEISVVDGIVRVAAPSAMSDADLRKMMRKRAKWIIDKLRPQSQRDSIRVDDTTIEYEVRRSKRRKKTVEISVVDGVVRVAAPSTMSDTDVRNIVRMRKKWIIGKAASAPPPPDPVQFVSGETLPYLGRSVPMTVYAADALSPQVRFDGHRFHIAVPLELVDPVRSERIQAAVIQWYRERAGEYLREGVERLWGQLGTGAKSRLLIRDQRRRWGSCSADGTLRFNWRAMMLEPQLVEYIVAHELAHLTVRNHSSDFWNVVARAIPDVNLLRKRLREVERTLPPL